MRRKITEVIESWAASDSRKVLLIKGSRQVGKTYSVEEFGNRVYKDHFLEINFKDEPKAAEIFDGSLEVDQIIMRMSARYRDFEFVPGKTLIFLDEIQDCPQARTALKPFAKDGRYRVIASGSLLGIRMKDVGLHPVGYLKREEMHPMDFEEFLWALGMPQIAIDAVRGSISRCEPIDESLFSTFTELYSRYLVVGGMPEAVESFVRTKTFSGLDDVFKDLRERYTDDISRYATGTAKELSGPCIAAIPSMFANENKKFMFSRVGVEQGQDNSTADSDETVQESNTSSQQLREGSRKTGFRYFAPALNWLSMAGITLKCHCVSEPASPLEGREQVNKFKLYMIDTGLLVSSYDRSVFENVFFGNPFVNMGAIAENAVAQAFAVQGRKLMYFSSNDPRIEIDFVTVVSGRVCCVEVKSGDNRSCRSLNNAMKRYNTDGIMFEKRNVFVDDKGVRHYPLFASSFMDAIDPKNELPVDLSCIDRIRETYGGEEQIDRRP